MIYYAPIVLAGAWVAVVLFRPWWALELPPGASSQWAREMAVLYAAPVLGLLVAALAVPADGRAAVLAGACVAVALSSLVDLWRWSGWGLAFDALMMLAVLAARAEAG